ncbi:hypothetical protein SDC9_103472 [bioreactor metagenome]|uniref:Uncharacterized protein n=1 Tax=bioreactor metagenome TaxID=1076179 RepID=A0A645B0I2_9ZZZZ
MVGPEQHLAGAHGVDEVTQRLGGEHGGVVVQPVEELGRRHRGRVRDPLAFPAHVQTAPQVAETAPAVREAQHQRRTFQNATEREASGRDRRLHRVPDELGEPEVAEPVGVRHAGGVQEGERPPFAEQAPQGIVDRGVQVTAAAPRADRDAGEAELVQAAACLVRRPWPAQRHRPERSQPLGGRRAVVGERVVAASDHLRDQGRIVTGGGEQERRQRDEPHVDAGVVHLPEAFCRVVHGAGERQRGTRADAGDPRVEHDDVVVRTRQVRQPPVRQPAQHRHRHRVRVDVDHRGIDHGDRGLLARGRLPRGHRGTGHPVGGRWLGGRRGGGVRVDHGVGHDGPLGFPFRGRRCWREPRRPPGRPARAGRRPCR